MDISNKQYDEMVKKASPPSKVVRDCFFAFVIGGVICVIGQIVNNVFTYYNFD